MRLAADKTKIATARTMKGETHVSLRFCLSLVSATVLGARPACMTVIAPIMSSYAFDTATLDLGSSLLQSKLDDLVQEIDIAVVKATAAQFHVVPKEKHVRSMFVVLHFALACCAHP